MKTVFLIVFLYAKWGYSGGPNLEIREMPNLSACETVGAAAVKLAPNRKDSGYESPTGARYVCVETVQP